jgi:carbon storage regulator CsrA
VLTRKAGEALMIGPNVRVTVLAIRGSRVKFTVKAPEGVLVCCGEVIQELNAAAKQALMGADQEAFARPTSPSS